MTGIVLQLDQMASQTMENLLPQDDHIYGYGPNSLNDFCVMKAFPQVGAGKRRSCAIEFEYPRSYDSHGIMEFAANASRGITPAIVEDVTGSMDFQPRGAAGDEGIETIAFRNRKPAIEDVYEWYSSLRPLIDVNHPVLRNKVNRNNMFIFVKYMKKIRKDPQAHWSIALLMAMYEEDGHTELNVINMFSIESADKCTFIFPK